MTYDKQAAILKCPGIEITRLELTKTSGLERLHNDPLLDIHKFVFYGNQNNISFEKSLNVALEIVLQNCSGTHRQLKICEIILDNLKRNLTEHVSKILSKKTIYMCRFRAIWC